MHYFSLVVLARLSNQLFHGLNNKELVAVYTLSLKFVLYSF